MYNTLDFVIWPAQNRDVKEGGELAKSLPRYYRISLSRGKELIPLSQELAHISLYFELQNKRFDEKIRLCLNAQDGLSQISILKLLLQPLVENCIVHGFASREETIAFTLCRTDSFLTIQLAVDSAGISAEKLARLRLSLELEQADDSFSGYGLHNIAERIRRYYGETASFRIESIPDVEICVYISLPLLACPLPPSFGFA